MKLGKSMINYYRSVLSVWWRIMSVLIFIWELLAGIRGELALVEDQKKLKIISLLPNTPWYWPVIVWLVITLIAVLIGSWKIHHALVLELEAEKKKAGYPDITIDVKEILRTQHSSLFVHMTLFNSSEAPTLIQSYRAVCTVGDKILEGEITDDVSTFEVVDRVEDINADGKLDWRDIRGDLLTDLKAQISPASQLKRGIHFSGWVRFYFGYSLDAPVEAPLPFSLILKDSYSREHSFSLECPPYNSERIIQRNKHSIKQPISRLTA